MNGETMGKLFSSASVEYLTPPPLLGKVERVAPIGLDPCAHTKSDSLRRSRTGFVLHPPSGFSDRGVVRCDGLLVEWQDCLRPEELAFVNPPYGRALKDWAEKMAREETCPMIALVPARVDTAWWRRLDPVAWCALAGRVKFYELAHSFKDESLDGDACEFCGLRRSDAKEQPSCPLALVPTESENAAPFPSAVCLVHGRHLVQRFVSAFGDSGPVYQRVS